MKTFDLIIYNLIKVLIIPIIALLVIWIWS
jgi:hypothetical protein